MALKVVVIIPTYNEARNIAPLVEALHEQFASLQHDMNVLVVDDNSPDGTADVVRSLQRRYAKLELIEGKKSGLGAAYVRGMAHAISQMSADVVFEMDADFSHDPRDVARLLHEIDNGADFVIGSRYVKGGSIPGNWGLVRRTISLGGNIVARYLAGIYRVRDCTAGFRAIRTPLLRRIGLAGLRVQGYAFQVALLHAAVVNGARIIEIPVDFIDRTQGESKLGPRDIVEFVRNAWWIRLQSSRTFIKFCIVGASGLVVNLGVFSLLLAADVNKFVASPIAIEVSIVGNFLLNNYWTFRWRNSRDRVRLRGLKFNAVSVLALAASYGGFVAISRAFPGWPPQISQLLAVFPATLVNYFLNSYWTFRNTDE